MELMTSIGTRDNFSLEALTILLLPKTKDVLDNSTTGFLQEERSSSEIKMQNFFEIEPLL
jgi:hypothetical protein